MKPITVKAVLEVLEIAGTGSFTVNGRTIPLPYTPEELHRAVYYAPADIQRLDGSDFLTRKAEKSPMTVSLSPLGSLQAAEALYKKYPNAGKNVLVLNFANPHRPGGGIREIPGTQEEVLCHQTTLLASIRSEAAAPFFTTNKQAKTHAQTDALIISPHALVLRNSDGSFREAPFPIALLTVSAPIAKRMPPEERENLDDILLSRIRGMLRAAMTEGYRHIVLGAWGCGAFGNDPNTVASLFHQALTESFGPGGEYTTADFFEDVVFALPDNSPTRFQWHAFANYFKENPL